MRNAREFVNMSAALRVGWNGLTRGHAERAVEADDLAIEIAIFDDVQGEIGVLVWAAECLWEGNGCSEAALHVFRQRLQHRCCENAGSDRAEPDAELRELPRGRKRQRGDPTFRRGIRRLSNLAVERGHRSSRDDHAALLVCERGKRRHVSGGETDRIEGADQVYLDNALEIGE